MLRNLIIPCLLVVFVCDRAQATIIDVPASLPTIQAGVDIASPGDTVLVAPGSYFESVVVDGKNIVLASLFSTTGDSSYIETTIIDANQSHRPVTIAGGVDTTMVLAGFTIQNGHMDGGGIACYGCSPKILNNVIQNNQGDFYAGGILLSQSSPIIESNIIAYNSAVYGTNGLGGGIFCSDNSCPRISNNTIRENTAINGGGIYCQWSSPVIKINTIEGNIVSGFGGGIFLTQSDPTICGNTVKDNDAVYGGGMYAEINSLIDLRNNGFFGNSSIMWGGAIYCDDCDLSAIDNTLHGNSSGWGSGMALFSSSIIIRNTIFSGLPGVALGISAPVTLEISYCDFHGNSGGDIDGTIPADFGVLTAYNANDDPCDIYMNIFLDPLYCDPDYSDYELNATSPAVGAGDGGSDIGAFGIGCGFIGVHDDESRLPDRLTLSQNYPNPFNPITMIEYHLPGNSHVKIDVFNVQGQKVHALMDMPQPAGSYTVVWDGRDTTGQSMPAGVYLYRLQVGEYIQTKRMLLLK